ncbi:MAG: transcriptional regulator [Actinomycetota bacterium]|nr:transcriptional regulator [Actinomycetota bacterium]
MLAVGRWSLVTGVLATLVALPPAISRLPVAVADVSTPVLLAEVRASQRVAYSGFAETFGTVAVPTGRSFANLTDLFGGHTRMRVWRRGPTDWRVDTVDPVGEHGTYRDATGAWLWDFADHRATRTTRPDITLPAAADLLPADLGRRLLSEATPGELHRLPGRRIAGRSAAGLRLRPAGADATVDRVDAWVDPGSGLPLRIEIWAKGATNPAFRSTFLDLRIALPPAGLTRFEPPVGATLSTDNVRDVGELARQYGFGDLPRRLAGLPLRDDAPSFGSYGRGPTFIAAVPLVGEGGFRLARRIVDAPGGVADKQDASSSLAAGPLSLLVAPVSDGIWLFTGTVTVAALRRAAAELRAARR